ncbi:prepilin peptidase [Prochlorococcus sp. AH-716-K03]|nr:prepilin peptidase [Prochlorococcus sp. AH-716-K03]
MEIIEIYLFVIGCSIGSFINVVIYRLPLNQSIVYPNSSCTECNTKIKWFDNLPIISWFLLRGKCRACKSKISLSYPIVALSTGLLVWLNFYSNPTIYSQLPALIIIIYGTILCSILITLAILDFKYFWLPQAITIGGLIVGISCSLIIDLSNNFGQFSYALYSITASLLGIVLFYLLSYVGFKIFNKPVMGGGDAKLSALIGSWVGIKGLLITIWLAFVSAGIFVILGLLLKKIKRNERIPFGVFLSFSGLIVWYFGNEIFLKLIF